MKLIKCPGCGREISDKDKNCIHCGCPIKNHFKNKSYFIIIILAILTIVLVIFYKTNQIKVIRGVAWEMSISQVINIESKNSGDLGYYDEDNGYYAVSNANFCNESVTLMYIFEDEKLESIWIQPDNSSYKNVSNICEKICENYGLPMSFKDNTEEPYIPNSRLTWNIKNTTIELIGNYESYTPSYYFSLKPYNGHEYGEKYVPTKLCRYGSKTSFPCRNYVVPWNDNLDIWNEPRDLCFDHGCYVIGCPNGFSIIFDEENLCLKHHFLCE